MSEPDEGGACPACEGHRKVTVRFRRKALALEGEVLRLHAEIARLKLDIFTMEHDEKEHQSWLERKVYEQRREINRQAEQAGR